MSNVIPREKRGPVQSESSFPSVLKSSISAHLEVISQIESQQTILESIAKSIANALCAGRKILWCGNGGSASDSQHLAAELVGRFRRERRGLPSISLTTDTSILTAVSNDFGFDTVFARQVEALGNPGDVLVGISTSGNSPNVLAALVTARSNGLVTVGFTGSSGGKIAGLADMTFCVSSSDTARVQEAHILVGHILCDWVELEWIQSTSKDRIESAEPGVIK